MRKSNQNYYRINILYHLSHCLYHWFLYCDRGCKFNWIIIRHCKSLPLTKNHNRDMNLFVRELSAQNQNGRNMCPLLKHNHMWTANKEEANDNMVNRMQIGHCRNTLIWFGSYLPQSTLWQDKHFSIYLHEYCWYSLPTQLKYVFGWTWKHTIFTVRYIFRKFVWTSYIKMSSAWSSNLVMNKCHKDGKKFTLLRHILAKYLFPWSMYMN